jgi:hypothetical protein
MTNGIRMACEPTIVMIALDRILPTRRFDPKTKHSPKYKCIDASVRELGLIEPIVVHPQDDSSGKFLLLDGHLRLEVLRDLGQTMAKCLISTDDEAFTYNHKVNRLAAIQEHFMIMRAIRNGVSEERIAKTLNVDIASIKRKRDLLDGICSEAVQLLRDKGVTAGCLRELRKVRPMRQIEIAELMCASHNHTVGYAKCLIVATPQEQLVEPDRPKEIRGLTAEDISRMERETESLGRDFKIIEESHGRNVLHLVVVAGFLRKLIDNARVVRFLSQNYREILSEFQKLAESRNLGDESVGN